jgi:malate dehydrogenase
MERRDLISKNVDIMKEQAQNIDKHSNKNVKVLIVANPANTNCLVAMNAAPSIPTNNFSCLTRLDEERLRGFILQEINSNTSILSSGKKISASAVQNVAIFGNHSATQVPYANNATFIDHNDKVMLVSDYCTYNKDELIAKVQKRGAAIIQAQQASSGLSAACAIGRHLRDWLSEEISNEFFSMGILSNGNPYNVPDGLVFSFPCKRISSKPGDIAIVKGLEISSHFQLLIDRTTDELLGERVEAESFVGKL